MKVTDYFILICTTPLFIYASIDGYNEIPNDHLTTYEIDKKVILHYVVRCYT